MSNLETVSLWTAHVKTPLFIGHGRLHRVQLLVNPCRSGVYYSGYLVLFEEIHSPYSFSSYVLNRPYCYEGSCIPVFVSTMSRYMHYGFNKNLIMSLITLQYVETRYHFDKEDRVDKWKGQFTSLWTLEEIDEYFEKN